jgi:hypothetical protein
LVSTGSGTPWSDTGLTPNTTYRYRVTACNEAGEGDYSAIVDCTTGIHIDFYQMDFNLDGTIYQDTDWGSVDFTFTGEESIMYFNLAVNGDWQVQNIPVLSGRGVGVEQTMTYYFDLGTERGTDITSLNYDYAFTSDILGTMPGGSIAASVGDDYVALWAGSGGQMPDLAVAEPLVGGEVVDSSPHAHKNFPNQQCGERECAPAAVSNSLQFLNAKHNLGMKADGISINEMKKAVGFVAGWGSPLDTWWELKKKYMEDKKYPITTRKITDMSKLAAEIDAGQDVEIQESWIDKDGKKTGHTSALVGITELENGEYSLDIADDTVQGDPTQGCENPRTRTYDPATGEFTGGGLIDTKFEYAVVECPPAQPLPPQPVPPYTQPFIICQSADVSAWGYVTFTYDGTVIGGPYWVHCAFTNGYRSAYGFGLPKEPNDISWEIYIRWVPGDESVDVWHGENQPWPATYEKTGSPSFVRFGVPGQYYLTVGASEGGTVTVSPPAPYAPGTVVTLTATPIGGYAFLNWTGDVARVADVNSAHTTITMYGDYNVTANFA